MYGRKALLLLLTFYIISEVFFSIFTKLDCFFRKAWILRLHYTGPRSPYSFQTIITTGRFKDFQPLEKKSMHNAFFELSFKKNILKVEIFGGNEVLCNLFFSITQKDRYAYWYQPSWKFCMLFSIVCKMFSKLFLMKVSFRKTIRASNRLDPDKARHFVGPDMGPNCLQKLSVDDTRR